MNGRVDDGSSPLIHLLQSFMFFGHKYSQIYVSVIYVRFLGIHTCGTYCVVSVIKMLKGPFTFHYFVYASVRSNRRQHAFTQACQCRSELKLF